MPFAQALWRFRFYVPRCLPGVQLPAMNQNCKAKGARPQLQLWGGSPLRRRREDRQGIALSPAQEDSKIVLMIPQEKVVTRIHVLDHRSSGVQLESHLEDQTLATDRR